MLPKPSSCLGCPLYQDGKGFVPDEMVPGAEVTLLGQNPGADEEAEGKPFIGRTGQEMMRDYFPRAGLHRGENVSIANTLKCRWIKNGARTNELPPRAILDPAVTHCVTAHLRIPETTKLIVAQGSLAWQALGNNTRITDWRGFLSPLGYQAEGRDVPVLATLHLADLFREPKYRIPSHRDWAKIPQYLAGNWPQPIPQRVEALPHNWESDVAAWFESARRAPFFVCDLEYDKTTKTLALIGLGYPKMLYGLQVIWPKIPDWAQASLVAHMKRLIREVPMVSQNAIGAELPVLCVNLGIVYDDFCRVDDTMLAHAVLWSEWPHDLEFLASVYGVYLKLKHLKYSNPMLYNWGDVIDTICVWEGLEREFTNDPESRAIYETQSLPLIPLLLRAHARGIRVNAARVGPAGREYADKLVAATRLARAYCGYPINLGSNDQLSHFLYQVERLPVQRHKDTKNATVDTDAIAALRGKIDPVPDFEEEERVGLSYLDAIGRVGVGANPLLEARVIYAAAQQAQSHYIAPLILPDGTIRERVYPEFHIHAQANARWSTVNGDSCKNGCKEKSHRVGLPMAQLPDDLRDIVYPGPGCVWLGWDWDQIELRINAAISNDVPTLQALEKGYDIHTMNMCDCFGYPYPPQLVKPYDAEENEDWRAKLNWRRGDKDDPRRVFAKRFVYRLDYGGEAKNAGSIPGAQALGLDKVKLVQASNRYLAAHPNKAQWRRDAAHYLSTTRELPVARTFLGRKRKLLGGGNAVRREYYDYPMQGSVSDVKNVTLVTIYQQLPWLDFMYEMHDSTWEQGRMGTGDCLTDPLIVKSWVLLKPIILREWNVQGVKMIFPATFKQQCVTHSNCFKGTLRA